jgi:hypothetical protein
VLISGREWRAWGCHFRMNGRCESLSDRDSPAFRARQSGGEGNYLDRTAAKNSPL